MDPAKTDLAAVGGAIASALQSETANSGEIRLARTSFLDAVATRQPAATHRARRLYLGMAFAGTLAVAGGLGAYLWMKAPISFEVGMARAKGRLGDVVEPSGRAPLPMRFSEGSSIQVAPNGRLRVLSATPQGARVLVERGALDVDIAHVARKAKRWAFEAGPFEIRVTGTRFHLSFDPRDQSIHLAMREGQVVVSAPCLAEARRLSAGGILDLSCQPGQAPSDPAVETAPAVALPDNRPTPATDTPARAQQKWRNLLASGRMREALRAANQAGLEHVCQLASVRELLQLGDAARLGRHSSKAANILRTLRKRFPESSEAATAAFTLGRIAFEDRRAFGEAAGYFSAYLAEAPHGPLMGDALGRLMESRQKSGDSTAARAEAEKYLRRFPTGPYSDHARVILSR